MLKVAPFFVPKIMQVFSMKSGSRELVSEAEVTSQCWINLENPSDRELEEVVAKTGVPEDMLKAALDEEERARIDIDGGFTMAIVDIPVIQDDNDVYVYSTLPLSIIFNETHFITVSLRSSAVLTEFVQGRVKAFDINKHTRFMYQILYVNATKYLHYLKLIDRTSMRVQTALHRSMKNKELIQLLDLEKALVYFSTSLNANQVVIDRVKQLSVIKHYEDDNDLLDDVIIENKQAIEMANIYRDIMSGTMDAFASVISNNQNIVMKLLTAITILLTIPTLVSGLFGMNVQGIPFANTPYGFWIVFGIVVAILIPVFIFMFKKKMF